MNRAFGSYLRWKVLYRQQNCRYRTHPGTTLKLDDAIRILHTITSGISKLEKMSSSVIFSCSEFSSVWALTTIKTRRKSQSFIVEEIFERTEYSFFLNNLLYCENRSKKEIHSSQIESSSFCVVTKQNTKGNSDHKTKKDKSRLNPRSSSLFSTMTASWWRQDTNLKKNKWHGQHLQHVDFNYK